MKRIKLLINLLLTLALILPAMFSSPVLAATFESWTVRDDGLPILSGARYAQTVLAESSHTISSIQFKGHRQNDSGGSPSGTSLGDFTVTIYSTTNGTPNSIPLGNSAVIAGQTIPSIGSGGGYQNFSVAFAWGSSQPIVSANQTYAVVITCAGTHSNNLVVIGEDGSGSSSYTGGAEYYDSGTGVWSLQPSKDIYFVVSGDAMVSVPLATVVTGSAYSSVVNGVLATTYTANLTDNADNTTILRGFQTGLTTGNYDINLQTSQLAIGGNSTDDELLNLYGYVWRGEVGEFSIVSTKLSANTTYYYRAFAVTRDAYRNEGYGYGAELSFTTVPYSGLLSPVVEISGLSITQNTLLNVGIQVLSSPSANLASVGFTYGTNFSTSTSTENITWFGTLEQPAAHVGIYAMSIAYDPLNNIKEGQRIFAKAFARDSLGNTGYSNIASIAKPFVYVGPGGLTVSNAGATVTGNIALVRASINNPAGVPITAYICSWGVLESATGQMVQLQLTSTPSTLSYTITSLAPTTVYFYKFGVYAEGVWVWSQPSAFTTGYTVPMPVSGMPGVVTRPATNIGANHFTANGDLVSTGNATVTEIGFAWSFTNSGAIEMWNLALTSGDYSLGLFSQMLTFSQSNKRAYYAAIARNIYGTSYGSVYYANMGTASDNGTDGGGSGTVPNPLQNLLDWLDRYGLNNPLGKWGIVLILMIILFFAFRESAILRVAAPLLAFGLGLVSGLLEWWIILLLAIVAAGVGLFIASKTQG